MSLKCPYCDSDLKSGQATIHGTVVGFLVFGFSHQNLYFKTDTGEEIKILGSGKSTPAMRCENCGIVTLNLDYPDQNDGDKLIDILTLCSSKELRDDLQKSNPDIDINSEIIKNWKENYLPDDPDFKNQFKNDELMLLERFDKLIKDNNWPEIEILAGVIIDLTVKYI